ncbi:MAG: DNA polymerase III subunit gamma/tau, partial [Candidatus Daviesbacteria bacterium]|nr:DNA polymerase III subunit gamma/tau [Candidatus Daviesbacteria bacterium]
MSDNLAFYLKYRPQTLSDLIGQESVKKTLLSSFQNNKLSHAYLFIGSRGTGKTSTARILAKMVNCENKNNVPCNKCATCISITDGSNLDLIEIDAAS